MARLLAICLGLVLALAWTRAAWAAPAASEVEEVGDDVLEALVPGGAGDVVVLVTRIEQAQAQATARLAVLSEQHERLEVLESIEQLLSACEHHVARHVEAVFFEDQLAAIRSRVLGEEARLSSLLEELAQNLDAVEQIDARWSRLHDAWGRRALDAVLSRADRTKLAASIQRVRASIKTTTKLAGEARDALVDFQAQVTAVLMRARSIDEQLRSRTSAAHAAWSRRQSPALWATDGSEGEASVVVPTERLMHVDRDFFDRTRDLWTLHGLFGLVLFVLAGRLHRTTLDEVTRVLFERSLALAVFGSGLMFVSLYQPTPPVIEIALWLGIGVGAFRLATAAFHGVGLSAIGGGLALGYPAMRVADVLLQSTLTLRWTLVVIAVGGAAGLALRAHRPALGHGRRWTLWLRGAAAVLVVAAIAEAIGFTAFSRGVFGAAIRTAFVLVALVIGRRVARGLASSTSAWLSRSVSTPWRAPVQSWTKTLGRALEASIVIAVALDVLYAWRLSPAPPEAWRAAVAASFSVFGLEISITHVGLAVLTLYLARQASRVVEIFLDVGMSSRGIDGGTGNSIKTLVRYVLIALAFVVALGILGIEPRSIAIVAGALGIGIGFGLQSVVADLTSGLILLFEGSIRTGDAVIIDGKWGEVRRIGLRSTVITMIDQSELVCPNSALTSEKLQNWTLSTRRARVFCTVGIAYGSDVDLAFRTLLEVADREPDAMKDPAPEVLFMQFGDSSLGLELRVWTEKGVERIQIRSRLLKAIDDAFREAGIEIAFPQRDLHLKTVDAEAVRAVARAPRDETRT